LLLKLLVALQVAAGSGVQVLVDDVECLPHGRLLEYWTRRTWWSLRRGGFHRGRNLQSLCDFIRTKAPEFFQVCDGSVLDQLLVLLKLFP